MCYHQNLTKSEVGRDQDGLEDLHIEEICESALFTKFGLVSPCIFIVGYVGIRVYLVHGLVHAHIRKSPGL